MKEVDKKLQKLASLYLGFTSVRTKENRTWELWINYLESLLKTIKEIMLVENLSYKDVIKLERIVNLILELEKDYNLTINHNSSKQVKVYAILENIREQYKLIIARKEEVKASKESYINLDEWIDEKNIHIIGNPKSKHDTDFELYTSSYNSEYLLTMDIRNIILNRNSSNSNRLYVLGTIKSIESSLTVDITNGKISITPEVTQLLQLANLVKNNLHLQQEQLCLKSEKELQVKILREVNEKTLKYCFNKL